MNKQNFKNGLNKYPVSTDTLDFMQEQVQFVAQLVNMLGDYVIIKQSQGGEAGLVVIKGELLPLNGTPIRNGYITIREQAEDIIAKGEKFTGARIIRGAYYTAVSHDANTYAVAKFSIVDDLRTLTLNQRQHVPKCTIIDWYGEASAENIPYGWVPCGGFYKTAGNITQDDGSIPTVIITEQNKWKLLYPEMESKIVYDPISQNYFLKINKVAGMAIPNLSGRFVVGAGYSNDASIGMYNKGEIGGEKMHRLTAGESGLPAHTHDWQITQASEERGPWDPYSAVKGSQQEGTKSGLIHFESMGGSYEFAFNKINDNGDGWADRDADDSGRFDILESTEKNAKTAHENRPPYFALYKLIKVI